MITLVQSTINSIPQTTYTGADATAILQQFLAIKDASGNPIFNITNLVAGNFNLPVVIGSDANGNVQSVSISGYQ